MAVKTTPPTVVGPNGTVAGAVENSSSHVPLNVIIPIGGIGSRFAKHGYRFPKPLINVVGRPMLLWLLDSLNIADGDTVWIAVNEDVDEEFRISQLVAKSLVSVDHHVVRLKHQTKGATETLYIVCQSMTDSYLERRTVSLDCDTIYWNDILSDVRAMPAGHGGCFYFADNGDKPVFSYIKTEDRNGLELIVDVQEKKAISRKANSGAYVFRSAGELKHHASLALDHKSDVDLDREVGEYFTSQLIAHMIENRIPYLGLHLRKQDVCCVGTPEQLQEFLRTVKSGTLSKSAATPKRRFCFDLDMTLVGVPTVAGDYSTCPPIERNIRLVQQLHKAGHHIIIHTARRMKTHRGNVGMVIADIGPITYAQLAKYEIPYNEIHFGKPYADVYVDDLAVNANLDTAREIGWLLDGDGSIDFDPSNSHENNDRLNKASGMIAARDFNTIQIVDNKVIKSSKSDKILGEIHYYLYLPRRISNLFPAVHHVDFIPETSTYTITMENCKGRTFSHMLVGRSLTKGRLRSMLKALHTIHTTEWTDEAHLQVSPVLQARMDELASAPEESPQVNIYANYGSKLRGRYEQFRDRYDALGPLAADVFNRLHEFLDTYEAEEKGAYAELIHGDPVFSNVIQSMDHNKIAFIDVRGQLGSALTAKGDINYDLAKVLQSLCGYDHVLLASENPANLERLQAPDEPLLDRADMDLLQELQGYFFEFVMDTYSVRLHRKTLLRITASLFFSLIPLHRPEMGGVFLRLCKDTLDQANKSSMGRVTPSMGSPKMKPSA